MSQTQSRRPGRPKNTLPEADYNRSDLHKPEGFLDIATAAAVMGNLPISTMYALTSRPVNPMPARKHGKRLAFYWPDLKAWSDRENGIAEIG